MGPGDEATYTVYALDTQILLLMIVPGMRALLLVCFLFPCLRWATTDSSTTRDLLWPLPHSATFGSNVYSLKAETFTFIGTGKGATQGESSKILQGAFDRYITLIFDTPTPFVPSGATVGASQLSLANLEVHVISDDSTLEQDTSETCKYRSCLRKEKL